jgi:hypothetical protein
MYTGLSVDAVSSCDSGCATRQTTEILDTQARERKHNYSDTSRTGTRKKAQLPNYFTQRQVKASTTTQLLHTQARGKAQLPRYVTHRHVKESKLPSYFTYRRVKAITTRCTQLLHTQARKRKHNYPDTSRTGR